MLQRLLIKDIEKLLKQFPCVAILGPRQVGKTTLAKQLSRTVKKQTIFLDIEKDSDRLKLQNAESYLEQHKKSCVIIDEIQFMPSLFNTLRPAIDEYRKPSRFIITGSASPALVAGVSESLAGRIAYTELTPISLLELPTNFKLQRHWFVGGFPDALTAGNYSKSIQWLNSFIKSYIERDLNQLFKIELNPNIIKNFWRMLASNSGGIHNAENYARALSVTGPTVNRYLDYLEGAFLVRRLYPWYTNTVKRLVKSPKLYIRDSGLLHRLANIDSMEALQGNTLIGASWEGYVIEQIAQVLPANLALHYYRTQDGAEVDLVIVKQQKVIACIEIKLRSMTLTKGFFESVKALKPKKCFLICQTNESYIMKENVQVCSLPDFLSNHLPLLAK